MIQWAKDGRGPTSQKPKWEVTYQGNKTGDGIMVTAVFPLECFGEVEAEVRQKIQLWKVEPK